MRRFAGAVQFLTIVPVKGETCAPGRAAVFFPLVGALLGASAGLVVQWAGALWALVFLSAATGCLHEDGLADVADAFRAGRTREKILLILKDSRIGVYGAMALVIAFAVRWQAVQGMRVNPVGGMCGSLALARASMVVLAATTETAGEGLGSMFARDVSLRTAAVAALQGVGLAMMAGWGRGVLTTLVSLLAIIALRAYFMRRLGGVNGDCLGATCHVVETLNLVSLTWPLSI